MPNLTIDQSHLQSAKAVAEQTIDSAELIFFQVAKLFTNFFSHLLWIDLLFSPNQEDGEDRSRQTLFACIAAVSILCFLYAAYRCYRITNEICPETLDKWIREGNMEQFGRAVDKTNSLKKAVESVSETREKVDDILLPCAYLSSMVLCAYAGGPTRFLMSTSLSITGEALDTARQALRGCKI